MPTYTFCGKTVSGPFTIPSGIITVTYDTALHFATSCPELGIVTTKSIGPEVRNGNREPVYAQVTKSTRDTFINAVGLAGPGAKAYLSELQNSPRLPSNKFFLISVFGRNTEDFVEVAQTLAEYADGYELNFSCPHAEGHGLELCSTPGLAASIVAAVKAVVPHIPIIPKLSPNLANGAIAELVTSLRDAGASGFTAINTVGPIPSEVLSNARGGLSGPTVFKRACEVVSLMRSALGPDVPIIGMGGVSSSEDVKALMKCGANFVGIGTTLTGLSTASCRDALRLMGSSGGITAVKAMQLRAPDMLFEPMTVTKITHVNPKLAILQLSGDVCSRPGQFLMVWIPGFGEKPFAPSHTAPCTIVVRGIGILTNQLVEKTAVGDTLQVRGINGYGTSFTVPAATRPGNTFIMVGGGTGIAPLLLLAKELSESTRASREDIHVYLGGRSQTELYYEEEFGMYATVHCATDDGTAGFHGTVVALLDHDLSVLTNNNPGERRNYFFYNCGPERMMAAAVKVQEKVEASQSVIRVLEASIERYMKCGVGICGVCSCDGLRMCVDGPIMGYEFLKASASFGKKHRTKTTEIIEW